MRLLQEVDIYIQPSCQEGLSRSVVEALSQACPCIGTGACGIPELIEEKCIFARKSSKDIAKGLCSTLDKEMLMKLAEKSWNRSKDFAPDVLAQKRNEYYQCVKENMKMR